MTKPESTKEGALFDLTEVERELRLDAAYARTGHTARTLVRKSDLRILLVAMKAGSRIAEHHANDTASIHALSGHVRLDVDGAIVELPAGRLLVLESGLRHDVEAVADSAFLLTLGWRDDRRKAAGG